jgi:hypothetical protein
LLLLLMLRLLLLMMMMLCLLLLLLLFHLLLLIILRLLLLLLRLLLLLLLRLLLLLLRLLLLLLCLLLLLLRLLLLLLLLLMLRLLLLPLRLPLLHLFLLVLQLLILLLLQRLPVSWLHWCPAAKLTAAKKRTTLPGPQLPPLNFPASGLPYPGPCRRLHQPQPLSGCCCCHRFQPFALAPYQVKAAAATLIDGVAGECYPFPQQVLTPGPRLKQVQVYGVAAADIRPLQHDAHNGVHIGGNIASDRAAGSCQLGRQILPQLVK